MSQFKSDVVLVHLPIWIGKGGGRPPEKTEHVGRSEQRVYKRIANQSKSSISNGKINFASTRTPFKVNPISTKIRLSNCAVLKQQQNVGWDLDPPLVVRRCEFCVMRRRPASMSLCVYVCVCSIKNSVVQL